VALVTLLWEAPPDLESLFEAAGVRQYSKASKKSQRSLQELALFKASRCLYRFALFSPCQRYLTDSPTGSLHFHLNGMLEPKKGRTRGGSRSNIAVASANVQALVVSNSTASFQFFPSWSAFLVWELWKDCCSDDFWYVDSNLARQRLRDLEIEKLQGLRNDARHQWAELVRQRVIFLRLHCSCFVHVCDNHACTHYDPASNMTWWAIFECFVRGFVLCVQIASYTLIHTHLHVSLV